MIAGSSSQARNARRPARSPVIHTPAARPASGMSAGVALVHHPSVQNANDKNHHRHAPPR